MAILIVTDNPALNIGLRSIIISEFDDTLILESDSLQSSLSAYQTGQVKTLVLDAGVVDGKDASLLDAFRQSHPDVAVVVHLGDDFQYIYAFIRTGIHALISKKSDAVEILEAIQVAQRKARFIGFDVQQVLLSHIAADPANRGLTRRERLIADLLAANVSYRQIAGAAKINIEKVSEYRQAIFGKLRVDNNEELAMKLTRQLGKEAKR
ncbi:DNA-binding response regulator [Dyadobacter beijingensis]|uniref:DNA-binding response regulator n=1 Tax=Dyadobacter beijingensis TaxID=365489 RepID=A0ABQ2IBR1_9BACT|nr:response regulator transcription factor [Dyadobacter beijingensis]GGN06310.1 DNA-binding response regulator [Dyadobacter beijingensis]